MVVALEYRGIVRGNCPSHHTYLLFSQFELAERVAAGGVRTVQDLGVGVEEELFW
jgi:hypothetical protein